jgi:hypothetical protein
VQRVGLAPEARNDEAHQSGGEDQHRQRERDSIEDTTRNFAVSMAPGTRCTSSRPIAHARASSHGAMKILRSGSRHVSSTRAGLPLHVSWCWIRRQPTPLDGASLATVSAVCHAVEITASPSGR